MFSADRRREARRLGEEKGWGRELGSSTGGHIHQAGTHLWGFRSQPKFSTFCWGPCLWHEGETPQAKSVPVP